ncbi:divergent polysaccharide deacetylase family protein [Chitinivibrio alkaliphilus]|uniref:Family 2 polysaccharide deacetylases protein n=1 Tax=Chitinivibrio alkaliphilus ACht1 TaxID=1313304 RepID=U7DD62_9BACT|nr:divergent polysaccharide deacetylase family protein [Chitinivibrio alkaliphilus]ERP38816.1 family 2 polysaccharide deacetylases protein [Chitinivibrio alkaliphilus ACht1]
MLLSLRESTTQLSTSQHALEQKLSNLERNIVYKLKEYGMERNHFSISLDLATGVREIVCTVPRGVPMEKIVQRVQQGASGTSYSLSDSYMHERNERTIVHFESSRRDEEDIRVILQRGRYYAAHTGEVHFIIHGVEALSPSDRLDYLTFPYGGFTYVLIPWKDNATDYYSLLQRYDQAVLTKIPLESMIDRNTVRSRFTIMLDNNLSEMELKIADILRNAPTTRAVASVGGSRVLSNSRSRKTFFKALSARNIPFYDRRPISALPAPNTDQERKDARSQGLTYLYENVSFDTDTEEDILPRLKQVADRAIRSGSVTLWVAATPAFISALEEAAPYFEERGIHLSPLP